MKKLFLIPVVVCTFFFSSSCEDDSKDPLPEKVSGQYIKLDIKNRELDYSNIDNTAFTGTLYNTSGNVVKYDLYVRRRDSSGFITGDYVLLQTITSFPYELSITPQQIAAALGVDVSVLNDGDVYTFTAYSYDAAGNKVGYSNLTRLVQVTATMEQGYRFNTQLFHSPTPLDAEVPYDNHQANP